MERLPLPAPSAANEARRARLAILAAITIGVQVGSNIVATRFVVHETTPAALALMRYVIGFLCLAVPAWLAIQTRFRPRDIAPMAILGILQFGILIWLLNVALMIIPSGRAALLFATAPFMTMLIAAALGREQLTWAKSTGVLLTIAGVALALGERVAAPANGPVPGGLAGWIGEVAALGSALCAATTSALYRPYVQRYGSLPVSAFAMLASVAFLAGWAWTEGFFIAPPVISAVGWGAIAFVGISSGVGYFVWLFALGNTTPTRVAVFLALSPITATVLGTLLLAEPVTMLFLTGLAVVVAGLVLATWEG